MYLIPINIKVEDITIKDIDYEELSQIQALLNESKDMKELLGKKERFQLEEIKERYLESLSSISDFFLGVYLENKMIGIIKGRFENRSYTEVWFLTYVLGEKYRDSGRGSLILKELETWFETFYSIGAFYVFAYENNKRAMNFWSKNKYILLRKTKIKHQSQLGSVVILEKRRQS